VQFGSSIEEGTSTSMPGAGTLPAAAPVLCPLSPVPRAFS